MKTSNSQGHKPTWFKQFIQYPGVVGADASRPPETRLRDNMNRLILFDCKDRKPGVGNYFAYIGFWILMNGVARWCGKLTPN